MESENGVPVEEEKMIVNVDMKEEENVCEKAASEEKADETLVVKTELSGNVPTIKASNQTKPSTAKNCKMAKDQESLKGTSALTRSKRASISQSLSFPASGVSSDVMGKSLDVYRKKSDAKDLKTTEVKKETSLSKGSSAYRVNPAANNGGVLKNANANGRTATSRRTTISAVPSIRPSMSGKSLSANGSTKKATCEVPNDENKKPAKAALPHKEDEDARSTTSSGTTPRGQRRASVAGFSFRLEERAEKRKEFLAKIEEKVQAREAEKNNLQEKSKENQEAEIRQLRKSLKFKATPMPSFYKEPPPKIELKKIPNTRAISPKLGRNKNSTSTTNSSESGGSCFSPRVVKEQGKSPSALLSSSNRVTGASKKPIETKKPMKNTLTTKTKGKAVGTKSKPAEAKGLDENICEDKSQEMHDKPDGSPQLPEQPDEKFEMIPRDGNMVQPSNTVVPAQVTVEG